MLRSVLFVQLLVAAMVGAAFGTSITLDQAVICHETFIPDSRKPLLSPSGTYDPLMPGAARPNVLFWSAFLIFGEVDDGLLSRELKERELRLEEMVYGVSVLAAGGRLRISVPWVFWPIDLVEPDALRDCADVQQAASQLSAWCKDTLRCSPYANTTVETVMANTIKVAEAICEPEEEVMDVEGSPPGKCCKDTGTSACSADRA